MRDQVAEHGEREELLDERFMLASGRIREIISCADGVGVPARYVPYFRETAGYVGKLLAEWDAQGACGLEGLSLGELRRRCLTLYEDILPENYGHCYGNPAFCAGLFGQEMGALLAFLYAEIHSQIASVYERDEEELLIRLELFLEIWQVFVCAGEEGRQAPSFWELRGIVYSFVSDYLEAELEHRVRSQLDPGQDFLRRIVMESDLSDSRYLYRYGEYITQREEQLSSYLNSLPEEKIRQIADTFTEGYRMGFLVGEKDITKKKTVNIRYVAGFERIIRRAIVNFKEMGLESVLYRSSLSIFHKKGAARVGFYGAEANRQFLYDHREDEALFLDKKYVGRKIQALQRAYEAVKELARVHGGPACMEAFGEEPFSPCATPQALCLDEGQRALAVDYASQAGQLVEQYMKGAERSFTIIAFPVPAIGDRFPEIFEAFIRINTLDYALYRDIQQTIIEALDGAVWVRIRGRKGNRTQLCVALHPLEHPERETVFENCVADVNIPVGEVFTSPRLEGTKGRLHVSRVFLNGLEFRELELEFVDGMVRGYGCANFPTEEENRRYIRDNVLFHHDSLPMGEFAIGTNTTAYVAAKRYGIEERLPILIAEKMGPHFAVGDTCYSHSEELPVHNPDGREMIARDNSCSIRRLENAGEAYFNCHTDITLPYDELGELTAVSADGREQAIIRDGRFVLPGCEELNAAFHVLSIDDKGLS